MTSAKQYGVCTGSAIIHPGRGCFRGLEVGRKQNKTKKTTFPSKCKHEALADLRSTVIAGFGFPQSSFLEILDGAE